jgi:hypothetical protein
LIPFKNTFFLLFLEYNPGGIITNQFISWLDMLLNQSKIILLCIVRHVVVKMERIDCEINSFERGRGR